MYFKKLGHPKRESNLVAHRQYRHRVLSACFWWLAAVSAKRHYSFLGDISKIKILIFLAFRRHADFRYFLLLRLLQNDIKLKKPVFLKVFFLNTEMKPFFKLIVRSQTVICLQNNKRHCWVSALVPKLKIPKSQNL